MDQEILPCSDFVWKCSLARQAQAGLELTLKFRLTSNSLPSPSQPPSARFHSMYELPGLARSAFSHSLWGA